jgi:hypothetical protein
VRVAPPARAAWQIAFESGVQHRRAIDNERVIGRSQAHAYELQEIPAIDLPRRVRSTGIPEANLRSVRVRPPIARAAR